MGAMLLAIYFKTLKIKALIKRGKPPHFYVVNRKGEKWHFKRSKDILPDPYNYLVFIGSFVPMKKKLVQE